jgi:hypothetical protein
MADPMSQRHLNHFVLKRRGLGYSVPERGTRAVSIDVAAPHPPQQHKHRHVGQRLVLSGTKDPIFEPRVAQRKQGRQQAHSRRE